MRTEKKTNWGVMRTKILFWVCVSIPSFLIVGWLGYGEFKLLKPKLIPKLEATMSGFRRDLSELSFAYFDGRSGKEWTTSRVWTDRVTAEQEQVASELLKDFSKAIGKKVEWKTSGKWSKDMITFPVYSVCVKNPWNPSKGNDNTMYCIWSNGYLIFDNMTVYKVDFDFSAFLLAADTVFPAEEIHSIQGVPMFSLLAEMQGWNTEHMIPSPCYIPENKDIKMSVLSYEYELTTNEFEAVKYVDLQLTNTSDSTMLYKWDCYVDVKVNGSWYQATLDPRVAYSPKTGSPTTAIEPGEVLELPCSLERYGSAAFGDLSYGISPSDERPEIRFVIEVWDENGIPSYALATPD